MGDFFNLSLERQLSGDLIDEGESYRQDEDQHNLHGQAQQENGAPKEKKKRNRKPVTCAQCRKRKLKCDRQNPCGACRDRGEADQCEWEGAIRVNDVNSPQAGDGVELRLQLDRLEAILSSLTQGGYQGPIEDVQPPQVDIEERDSAVEALGLLAGTSNAGAGIGLGGLGAGLGGGLGQSQPHLLSLTPSSGPPSIDQILSILPHRNELDGLINQFLTEEIPFLPILHAPSFRLRYSSFDRTSARNDPAFVALLLAIAGWETYWRTTDPRSARSAAFVKEGTIRTYLHSAMESLHAASYMENPSLDAIRTLLVLAHYHTQQESGGTTTGFLLSTAIKLAQNLGLNREPAIVGVGFGFIEAEERRRLWAILVCSDWLEPSGRTYTISPNQYDTLLPTNTTDEELTSQGIVPRPLPHPTPALYLILRTSIASAARSLTDRAFGISLVSFARVVELSRELDLLDQTLPPFEWNKERGTVLPFEEAVTNFEWTRVLVHLQMRHQFIRLCRPFLTRGLAEVGLAYGREKCCWAARFILSIHRGLGDDYRATRNWALTFHTLNALCVLAVDLFQDPRGQHSEGHRADLMASMRLLEQRASKSKLVKETLRVVNVLLRRASGGSFADQAKKRKLDDLLNGGSSALDGSNSGAQGGGDSLGFLLSGSPLVSPPDHLTLSAPPRPFDPTTPFRLPLPLPMTQDPLALHFDPLPDPLTPSSSTGDAELENLWAGLIKFRLYGAPDRLEWKEIARSSASGGKCWGLAGVDLVF